MPRSPRSRPARFDDPFSSMGAMAIAVIVAGIAAVLLAVVVLGPFLGSSSGAGDERTLSGIVAGADVPSRDPDLAATASVPTLAVTETAGSRVADPTIASGPAWTPWANLRVRDQANPVSGPRDGVQDSQQNAAGPTERAQSRPTRTPEPRVTRTPTPRPTATPDPTATVPPTPTREPDVIAYYLADAVQDLRSWSGPSWRADGTALRSDGTAVLAQPWISGPVTPPATGGYAMEAEIRIDGLLPGYCKQSVGLIAPLPGGAFIGAGVLYECDGSGARARISDVSDYTNGYFQDPELATGPLEIEDGWHTVRLEIDGDRVRLLLDGDLVLSTTAGSAQVRNPDGALGLWSEGVEVSVRRIAVVALEMS